MNLRRKKPPSQADPTRYLSPAQIAAAERWWRQETDAPVDWNWILTPDTELAKFMALTPQELEAFL